MLNKLRNSTQKHHEELEKENLARKIITHDISLEEYKLLLFQNYIAYKITEAKISEYITSYTSNKSEQLAADLESLEIDNSISKNFHDKFSINSHEEALGAAYVVLGSALGGVYISKEIPNCPHLQEIDKPQFFNGNRDGVKAWNKFVKKLKAKNFDENQIEIASQKAIETFEFFDFVFKEATIQEQA